MSIASAELIVELLTLYASVGVIFAFVFCWRGVERVDPVTRQTGIFFRLLIAPGVAALWPLLAWRWYQGTGSPPDERSASRVAAMRSGEDPEWQGSDQ